MRTTKLAAVLATLAVTGATATALAAAPAQAQTATQVTLTISGRTSVTAPYGTLIGTLSGEVSDGVNPVTVGSVLLEQKLPGKDWTTTSATDADLTDGVDFGSYGSHARSKVKYRAHYLGGTDGVTTWDPSYSDVVTVITLWKIKDTSACNGAHCHISGRLVPKAKNHKIRVQVKHGGWQKYRVLHTNRKSKYRVGVTGSRRGTKYRIIITGTRQIAATEQRYIVRLVPARNARAASVSPR